MSGMRDRAECGAPPCCGVASRRAGVSDDATMSSPAISSESAVARAVDSLITAMLAADGPALDALAADGISYGHSTSTVDDRARFLERLSGPEPGFRSIEISDQSVVVKGTTAVVRHTFTAVAADGGDVRLHNLLVWTDTGGGWKLLARQAVKLP